MPRFLDRTAAAVVLVAVAGGGIGMDSLGRPMVLDQSLRDPVVVVLGLALGGRPMRLRICCLAAWRSSIRGSRRR